MFRYISMYVNQKSLPLGRFFLVNHQTMYKNKLLWYNSDNN